MGQPEALEIAAQSADSVVASWVESRGIPGAVLSVALDGEVVLERAHGSRVAYGYGEGQYGTAESSQARPAPALPDTLRIPMTVDAIFDLASVTKVVGTTLAAMLLVDQGRLSLDDPVSDVLPDFTGGGKERITARHLLAHRSGLSAWQPVYYTAGDPDRAYAFIRDFPLESEPGEVRRYSDLGFMVLGRMLETVVRQALGSAAGVRTLRAHGPQPDRVRRPGERPRQDSPTWPRLMATRSSIAWCTSWISDTRSMGTRTDGTGGGGGP